MTDRKQSTENLIARLKSLPEQDPPPELRDLIMAQLENKRPGFFAGLNKLLVQPRTISLRPGFALAGLAVMAAAFFLGRHSVTLPQQPETALSPPPPQAFTAPMQVQTARSAYQIGRALLDDGNPKQAIPMLHQAATLSPETPEYAYWEGLAYWQNGDREKEFESYSRGLASSPRSIPLLTNLAHNYVDRKQYDLALQTYNAILQLSPEETTALYNMGLIARKLARTDEEIDSWKRYLAVVRTGDEAFRAVTRLNQYGDFSHRLYRVGIRRIILSQDILLHDDTSREEKLQELAPLLTFLTTNREMRLEIAVFAADDAPSARRKAMTLKNILVETVGHEIGRRIGVSWFDTPEEIDLDNRQSITLREGLLLFTRSLPSTNNEA